MRFFTDFGTAISSYPQAFSFIKKHKLWHLLIIPSLLNLLAVVGVAYISWVYTGVFIEKATLWVGLDTENYWFGILHIVLSFVIRLFALILYFKLYRYIVLIFFAPMLAFISDKIQEIDTGINRPFSLHQFANDILRGIRIALKNLFLELLVTGLLMLLALVVPVFAFVVPWLIFTIESYYYGFAMLDYRNEFARLSAKESRELINGHRGLAIGNGAVFNVVLLVPIVGALIAPVIAVVAAGLSFNRTVEN